MVGHPVHAHRRARVDVPQRGVVGETVWRTEQLARSGAVGDDAQEPVVQFALSAGEAVHDAHPPRADGRHRSGVAIGERDREGARVHRAPSPAQRSFRVRTVNDPQPAEMCVGAAAQPAATVAGDDARVERPGELEAGPGSARAGQRCPGEGQRRDTLGVGR